MLDRQDVLVREAGVTADARDLEECTYPFPDDRTVVDCDGTRTVLDVPVIEVVRDHEILRLSCCGGCAESHHTCALLQGGTVACWGDRFVGQLGTGSVVRPARLAPLPVEGLPPIVDLDSGPAHICAIGADTSVWCWGWNVEGQLGDGSRATRRRPVRVRGLEGLRPVALSLGSDHSCALLDDGRVACWGAPWGYGETDRTRTARVVSVPRPVVELYADNDFTCVRDDRSAVWCGGFDIDPERAP
jgi:alpha-tubulin suppressor-like RCC1 family protein